MKLSRVKSTITEFIILLIAKKDLRLSVSYKIVGSTTTLTKRTKETAVKFKKTNSENSPIRKFIKKMNRVK